MKKLTLADLKSFRDSLKIPISDEVLEANPYLPPYYNPSAEDEAVAYALERRGKLGGGLPSRRTTHIPLHLPDDSAYAQVKKGSGKQNVATTMAFVRLLKDLMRDKEFGPRIVPIIPDEARTFGMDSSSRRSRSTTPRSAPTSVDADPMLAYKRVHGGPDPPPRHQRGGLDGGLHRRRHVVRMHETPMVIPIYIFYSMFGSSGPPLICGRQIRLHDRRDRLARRSRRGPSTRRRPQPPARVHQPGCRLRPGLRLRDRAHIVRRLHRCTAAANPTRT